MMVKKRVSVKIFGNEYTVKGDHSEEYIQFLAEKIDETMKEIGRKNRRYSPTMIAVLTALNLADTLHKKEEELQNVEDNYKNNIAEYTISADGLKNANQELEIIKENLKKSQEDNKTKHIENKKLNRQLSNIKDESRDLKYELDVSKTTIKELQNKLYENQVELLKTKKELENLKNKSYKGLESNGKLDK